MYIFIRDNLKVYGLAKMPENKTHITFEAFSE